MIDEFALSVQRLARETGEHQFRSRALALLRVVMPFDSGSWGIAKRDRAGVKPCSVQLFEQSEALLHSYAAVRAHDRIGEKTTAHPGQTHISSWRDGHFGANDAFRSHCEEFGHYNILSTMSEGSLGLQNNFITVARGQGSRPFDETERAKMQQLLPHLLDAWIVNRSWHMRTSPDASQAGEVISGICSAKGELRGDHPAFAQLIADRFPGWLPPQLPLAITAALEQHGSWRHENLVINSFPIADVVFLTARVASEIDKLTAREKTIAKEAAEGFSYKEIARTLGLSPATIRAHLHNIYGKLEISNKTALSRAISAGVRSTTDTNYSAVASFATPPKVPISILQEL